LVFGVYRTGQLWMGNRDPTTTTPVLYLPTVAGSFVSTIVLGALVTRTGAHRFFGVGVLSWLAIESVLLHRLYTASELPPPLRPTLGIQLAPPAVGPLDPSYWRSAALQRALCGCCSGDDCSRLRFSRHQKASTRRRGLYRIRPPEWRSADPGAPGPCIEPPMD
jgi:hypothetical protein